MKIQTDFSKTLNQPLFKVLKDTVHEVGIKAFVIGGWVFKTISEQEETIYSDWDDDENFNDEVG